MGVKQDNKSMSKTHTPHPDDFRQGAVELLMTSGRPLTHVADELGISPNALRRWRDASTGRGRPAKAGGAEPPGRSGAAPAAADPFAEIRRLRREVEYLRRQREILKKAVGILSEVPPSGMP